MPQTIATNSEASRGDDLDGARDICNALHLFLICRCAKCRRTGACLDEPGSCIARHRKIVPAEVWDWVEEKLRTQDDTLTKEDVKDALEPHMGAYRAWIAGVEAGRAARRTPRHARP